MEYRCSIHCRNVLNESFETAGLFNTSQRDNIPDKIGVNDHERNAFKEIRCNNKTGQHPQAMGAASLI